MDSTGKLWPGYHELSDALARPEDKRTDLEQRAAGAARWWRRASMSTWPSEVIVAGMSALECLLMLATDERREKRGLVAARASAIAVLATMQPTAQVGWLHKLYERRNEALHAGRFHQDDLDARNLLELVDLVLHRTVRHLDPWHRGTNACPCTTAEEALADHEQD